MGRKRYLLLGLFLALGCQNGYGPRTANPDAFRDERPSGEYFPPAPSFPGAPSALSPNINVSQFQPRIDAVASRLYASNPNLRPRPRWVVQNTGRTVGPVADQLAYINEGTVASASEGQLAGLLALQLADLNVAQRRQQQQAYDSTYEPFPEHRYTNDGGTDTEYWQRYGEMKELNQGRRRPTRSAVVNVDPAALAKEYLLSAGYSIYDLDAGAALLRR